MSAGKIEGKRERERERDAAFSAHPITLGPQSLVLGQQAIPLREEL